MFERFTDGARATVTQAQNAARTLGHRQIGTEHLLLGLLEVPDGLARRVFFLHGVTAADVRAAVVRSGGHDDGLDAEALAAIGIDLAAVREKVESAFGPGALDGPRHPKVYGHIPFTPRAKKVLELSLREALRLKHKSISDGHLLLGILRQGGGLAARALTDTGLRPDELRTATEHELNQPESTI